MDRSSGDSGYTELLEAIRLASDDDRFAKLFAAVKADDSVELADLLGKKRNALIAQYGTSFGRLTLMHTAASFGALKCAEVLHEHFPKMIHSKASDHSRPLHHAALKNKKKFAGWLIDSGAKPFSKDREKMTPADWRIRKNSELQNTGNRRPTGIFAELAKPKGDFPEYSNRGVFHAKALHAPEQIAR